MRHSEIVSVACVSFIVGCYTAQVPHDPPPIAPPVASTSELKRPVPEEADEARGPSGIFKAGNFSYLIFSSRWTTVLDHEDLEMSSDSPQSRLGHVEGLFLLVKVAIDYHGRQTATIPVPILVDSRGDETEQSRLAFGAKDALSGFDRISFGGSNWCTLVYEYRGVSGPAILRVRGDDDEVLDIPLPIPEFRSEHHR